jgi:hypothetical protein
MRFIVFSTSGTSRSPMRSAGRLELIAVDAGVIAGTARSPHAMQP